MTDQEKNLLLKDLCARLPYKVKIQSWYGEIITSDLNTFLYSMEEMDKEDMWDQLSGFKPYLRPLSSMTEDEKETYEMFFNEDGLLNTSIDTYLDWLLENHFDYRGLIHIGLALKAPKGMYKN